MDRVHSAQTIAIARRMFLVALSPGALFPVKSRST